MEGEEKTRVDPEGQEKLPNGETKVRSLFGWRKSTAKNMEEHPPTQNFLHINSSENEK